MRSAPVTVTGEGVGINDALTMTENIARETGLGHKETLHLRLLAEELFGLIRSIAGEVEATYWIENADQSFELHMTSAVKMTDEIREQLISASSDKKNAAAKGFMGKVRVMIIDALFSMKDAMSYAMMDTVSTYPLGGSPEMITMWSMDVYKDEIRQHIKDNDEAAQAWD